MRKHNEGYALVLVLVVLIVLALLSTIILTGAQRNLDAQVTSIEYMKAKYQAQGEIEKVTAKLEALLNNSQPIMLESNLSGNPTIEVAISDKNVNLTSCYTFDDTIVQIDCTLTLICNLIAGNDQAGYTVTDYDGISCTNYEISTKEVTTNDETP